MQQLTALLDANVLFSPPLRDLLIELSCEQVFHARWTDKIHEEWTRAAAKLRPDLPLEIQQQIRRLLDQAIPDCLITDYEHLTATLTLPDKDDRHVLAAAIAGQCNIIITRNFRDFPKKALRPYNIEVQEPHTFLKTIAPEKIRHCTGIIRERLNHMDAKRYITALRKNRLKAVANMLENEEI